MSFILFKINAVMEIKLKCYITYFAMASEEEVPNTDHYVYKLLAQAF